MKVLFNIARYTLAGYGLLVFIGNLQKMAARSAGENSEENHISEPELKDVMLYGVSDSGTLEVYAYLNNFMKSLGKVTYSDVNQILTDCEMPKVLEDSESVGWDSENFKPIAQYSKEVGCIAIFLPKAKKLA